MRDLWAVFGGAARQGPARYAAEGAGDTFWVVERAEDDQGGSLEGGRHLLAGSVWQLEQSADPGDVRGTAVEDERRQAQWTKDSHHRVQVFTASIPRCHDRFAVGGGPDVRVHPRASGADLERSDTNERVGRRARHGGQFLHAAEAQLQSAVA
uniref:(northern house mosquito) hypothetical protein n=1 Tax=Culex pipiens TaxID=7175 RepID=A0A8D8C278_CULPI